DLIVLTPIIHQALLSTSYLNDEGDIGMQDDRMEGVLKQGLISFIGVILFGGALVFMQFSEVNKRRKLEDELRGLATADALTGTNNRRHYLELSELELHRIRRHKRPLSVLMMDLDRFKAINDTYGHAVGDEVLRRFVEICSLLLRQEDIMGRLGGEEFAVTLPEESAETARITAERLCRNLELESVLVEGGEVRVTVSIGVAELTDEDETFEDCLYRADAALYVAKNAGRNRVEMA
ncbi:MAG: GGDEF domain-containing protein, partial [Alphaproteobacteria bacterium]